MTDNSQGRRTDGPPGVKSTSSGMGMVVVAVILVLGIIAAIWYFQSSEGANENTDVTISIDPNADPGVGTTILP